MYWLEFIGRQLALHVCINNNNIDWPISVNARNPAIHYDQGTRPTRRGSLEREPQLLQGIG